MDNSGFQSDTVDNLDEVNRDARSNTPKVVNEESCNDEDKRNGVVSTLDVILNAGTWNDLFIYYLFIVINL